MSNGKTGFHATAIASMNGSHHQCLACTAKTSTMSAMIETMNRMTMNVSVSISATPMSSATDATRPGARAVRRNAGRP